MNNENYRNQSTITMPHVKYSTRTDPVNMKKHDFKTVQRNWTQKEKRSKKKKRKDKKKMTIPRATYTEPFKASSSFQPNKRLLVAHKSLKTLLIFSRLA